MTKKSSSPSESESSANPPRVGETIPLKESMLRRTLLDALLDPVPFPRLKTTNEGDPNCGTEEVHPEPNPPASLESGTLLDNLAEQQNVNEGQKRVNGQLCRVDWMLIEAFRSLRIELAKLPGAHSVDFEKIDHFLTRAYHTNGSVAEIRPPGCEPALVPDPNWEVSTTKVA